MYAAVRATESIEFDFASVVFNKAFLDSIKSLFSGHPFGFGYRFAGMHQAGDKAHCFGFVRTALFAAAKQCRCADSVPDRGGVAVVDVGHFDLRLCCELVY